MKTKDRQLQNEKIKKLKKEREFLSTGEMKKETKNLMSKCTQDDLYGVYMSQMICYTQDYICIRTLLQRHRLLNIKVLSQGF